MIQNVIQVGNSLGVTLPREFVVKHKIKTGSRVAVTITPVAKSTKYELVPDDEFMKLIKDVESRYGSALDDLAKLQ